MKKYKNPILLQAHWDMAKSAEAKENLTQLEAAYQQERKEQEENLFVQDSNFYQGLKDGLHVPSQEQAYLDYKDDRRLRLQDKYLSEGDKTLESYHPELFEQTREQEKLEHKEEVSTAKTMNDGYLVEKHEPRLALMLRENIGDITHRTEQTKDFVKGQELSLEERSTGKRSESIENTMEVSREVETDLTIETDNEPDLEVDTPNSIDDISPDNDFTIDIDD